MVGLLAPLPAEADQKDQARALIDQGNVHLREGRYEDALGSYREAFAVYPSPKIRLNIAEVHNQLGQFVKAIAQYEAYLDETEGETELTKAAAARRDALIKKIGHAEVRGPTGAMVSVDGDEAGPVPAVVRLDPGKHSIRVVLPEHEPFSHAVTITPGAREIVVAELSPRSAPPAVATTTPPPSTGEEPLIEKWWFWTIVGGVVLVGVATGVGIALGRGDDTLPEGEIGTFGTGSWDSF